MNHFNGSEDQMLDELLGEKLRIYGESEESAPEEIRHEVFSTLDTLNFLGELAEFFTLKFTEAEFSIFEAANDAFSSKRK
ncbi:MAG: hypothetical protein R2824_28720 [Saprospiraceae bacterium]|nr:hypothetical protein [Lewinella sp.]